MKTRVCLYVMRRKVSPAQRPGTLIKMPPHNKGGDTIKERLCEPLHAEESESHLKVVRAYEFHL